MCKVQRGARTRRRRPADANVPGPLFVSLERAHPHTSTALCSFVSDWSLLRRAALSRRASVRLWTPRHHRRFIQQLLMEVKAVLAPRLSSLFLCGVSIILRGNLPPLVPITNTCTS